MCSWYGTALLQHCPPVLHFNAKLQVCDSPEHANCVQRTTTAPVSSTATAVPVSSVTTAVPISNLFQSTVHPQQECVTASQPSSRPSSSGRPVPLHPGPIPLLLPNPVDCGSFYICSWYGTALLQHCPPVLHFNAKLQVCDSPEHANCIERTTAAHVSSTSTAAQPSM
nr:peritrophin-1-like [Penaeus vannamei]